MLAAALPERTPSPVCAPQTRRYNTRTDHNSPTQDEPCRAAIELSYRIAGLGLSRSMQVSECEPRGTGAQVLRPLAPTPTTQSKDGHGVLDILIEYVIVQPWTRLKY